MSTTGDLPNDTAFLQLIFTDPALLTAALLITTSYLTRARRSRAGYDRDQYHIFRMRGLLFRTINKGMSDSTRSLSNQMLAAVALSSAFELEHDPSLQSYKTQMDGLMLMIDLRGGLGKMGETEPMTERFFVWHIDNTAMISGQRHYYERASRTSSLGTRPRTNNAAKFRLTK